MMYMNNHVANRKEKVKIYKKPQFAHFFTSHSLGNIYTYCPFYNKVVPFVPYSPDTFRVFRGSRRIGLAHSLRVITGLTAPDFVGSQNSEAVLHPR